MFRLFIKKTNLKHLRYIGFINKNGVILKDPDILRKIEELNLVKSIIKRKAIKDRNISINNKQLFLSKTSYNKVNYLFFFKFNKLKIGKKI